MELVLENQKVRTYGAAAASSLSFTATVANICAENVLAESCGSTGRITESGCSVSSPCVPVGHKKKIQQFQTKAFQGVFFQKYLIMYW